MARRVLATWGTGDCGRLGHASPYSSLLPQIVRNLLEYEITSVSCGGAHTLAVTNDGTLFSTGLNDRGQLGHGPDAPSESGIFREVRLPGHVVAAAAGHWHSVALTDEGAVWTWGEGSDGQLGLGRSVSREAWPRAVRAFLGTRITTISAGANHTLALDETGQVYSWGADVSGCLGHGGSRTTGLRSWFSAGRGTEELPRIIRAFETRKIVQVSAGYMHSIAITSDGGAFAWGDGRMQQLGIGSISETEIPRKMPVEALAAVAAGGAHSLAVARAGGLLSWGANQHGVLGIGHGREPGRALLSKLPLPATAVAAGWKHSLAHDAAGRLWAWGWGGSQGDSAVGRGDGGQLGQGNAFDYWEPMRVTDLKIWPDSASLVSPPKGEPTWRARTVDAGMAHSAAVIELSADTHV